MGCRRPLFVSALCRGAAAAIVAALVLSAAPPSVGASAPDGPELWVTIGDIPPQYVLRGMTLVLHLQSSSPAATEFEYAVDAGFPAPHGAVDLGKTSGIFTYTPASDDKFSFRITFAAVGPGDTRETQSVLFVPLANLRPETDVIERTAILPDASADEYRVTSETANNTAEMFNGVMQTTTSMSVSAKTLNIDAFDPRSGNMYARLHERRNLKKLFVYAETLVVRSPLHLPGTDVVIYAREIRFEDQRGIAASIDTTPIPIPTRAAQFASGQGGQKGGDITLHVGAITAASDAPEVRFITNGSDGQAAGQGAPGSDGWGLQFPTTTYPIVGYIPLTATDKLYSNVWVFFNEFPWLPAYAGPVVKASAPTAEACDVAYSAALKTRQTWTSPTPNAMYIAVWNGSLGNTYWPGNGGDATPGGKPGNGGPGGSIAASIPLPPVIAVSQTGGVAGGKAAGQPGGAAGTPARALWIRFSKAVPTSTALRPPFTSQWMYCATEEYAGQSRGRDFVPPEADIPVGASGTVSVLDQNEARWLHPYFLRMVIAYARDVYRAGDVTAPKDTFTYYLNALQGYGAVPPEFQDSFDESAQEMTLLLSRIVNARDYYGNPPGWAPLLALGPEMRAFSADVKSWVRLLNLSLFLQNQAARNVQSIDGIHDAILTLVDDTKSSADKVNAALALLPALQAEAAAVDRETSSVLDQLHTLEGILLQRAKDNIEERNHVPVWKKGLEVMGAITQVAAIAMPKLQPVSTALDFIRNIDKSPQPWDDIEKFAQTVNDARKEQRLHTGDAASRLQDFIKAIKSDSLTTVDGTLDVAKQIAEIGRTIQASTKTTIDAVQPTQVPLDDVTIELERIKQTDPSFIQLSAQVDGLKSRQVALGAAQQQADDAIGSGLLTINQNASTIATQYQAIDRAAGQIDHGMVLAVHDMELRARDRLLQGQYWMSKAYEQGMLEPYPGDLNIDEVVAKIFAGFDGDWSASAAHLGEVEAVYLDSVREIVSRALTALQSAPPEKSEQRFFSLTQAELDQLNRDGRLSFNLASRVPGLPDQYAQRLAGLRVFNMTVKAPSTLGPIADVRVIADLDNESILTKNGTRLRFVYGSGPFDRVFTISWLYLLPGGQVFSETPSDAGIAFLQSILNVPTAAEALASFARPGIDTTITISKIAEPAGMDAPITSLQFAATVDFLRRTTPQATLQIRATDGVAPYVAVSVADITGRQDCIGTCSRTFVPGQSVTLSAEAMAGTFKLSEWRDASGRSLGTSPSLALNMAVDQDVEMVYTQTARDVTKTLPPDVLSETSSAVTSTTATVSVIMNPNGLPSTAFVEYGGNAAYGSRATMAPDPAAGTSNVEVKSLLSGLTCDSVYHFRGVATNAGGVTYGEDSTFTTAACPVAITINPSDQSCSEGEIARFTIATRGTAPSVRWETAVSRGISWVPLTSVPPYTGTTTPTLAVSCAAALTGSRYRAVASNAVSIATSNAAALTVRQSDPTRNPGTPTPDPTPTPSEPATFSVDRLMLNYAVVRANATVTHQTPAQTLVVTQHTGGTMNWTVSVSHPWLHVSQETGTGNGSFTVSIDTASLPTSGDFDATLGVSSPDASTNPQLVTVHLRQMATGTTAPPSGYFDTPTNGATNVIGAVPVTGWAIDDVAVDRVELWRDPVSGEATAPNGKVFIGNAVLVAGSRPDVEALTRDKPMNYRSGWGYLLLTNLLPDATGNKAFGGNGTFTLYAYADDVEGHQTFIGSKRITCNNAAATAPFGTIDTPAQGETVSGTSYPSFGWALSPKNTIPKDGSSINVYIDGIDLGHPAYNLPRSDIQGAFPGYANTEGAVGLIVFDTTKLANGVHTIGWIAYDDAGHGEGLGSRFFTVFNGAANSVEAVTAAPTATSGAIGSQVNQSTDALWTVPLANEPIEVRRAFTPTNAQASAMPEWTGRVEVQSSELEAVELRLPSFGTPGGSYEGYLMVDGELRPLPSGSALDPLGVFTWQPGPSFVGGYDFVFIRTDASGVQAQLPVHVIITPKK